VGRMDALMGSPVTDPHGESIPGPTGRMPERLDSPLSTLAAGEAATVARVKPTDPELLRYLGGLGIYPQVALTVEAVAPFDGPVTVLVAGQRHAIGRAVAAQIFVADVHVVKAG
jgi:DtxR family transcriptional regulator, Mn-dependent transcriptional regulator